VIRFVHPPISDYRERLPKPERREGGRRLASATGPRSSGDDEHRPLVTIVTAVRNGDRFLAQSIESVLTQTYPHVEYIIADGGSSDRTLEIIEGFGDRIDYWVSETDMSPFDGMNRGIAEASGRLVKVHAADDIMPSNSVEIAVETYRRRSRKNGLLVIRGNMELIDDGERVIYVAGPGRLFAGEPAVLHPTWYVPIEIYERWGLYDPNAPVSSDYELYFYLLSQGVEFVDVDSVLCRFRTGGASSTFAGVLDTFHINRRYRGLRTAAYVATLGIVTKSIRRAMEQTIGVPVYTAMKRRLRRIVAG
jgi:glycosyltransferase involved in cell wall biosynthesis